MSGAKSLLFAGTSIQVLRANPACYIISIGDSFLGTNRSGHEGDQTPPPSAEFTNAGSH